jgi:membrane-associated HD superfamily phosphohydrolase
MSYRIIEKLNLVAPFVLILNNVAQSIVNVRNSENRLEERLVEIENEVKSIQRRLKERNDEDFFEKYNKEDVQTRIDNLESESNQQNTQTSNLTQTVEELTIIFEETQNVIDGTVENAEEGVYLTKKLAELKLEQVNIEKVQQPQINLFKKIAKNKKDIAENLFNTLEPIRDSIDGILDTIDIEITKISAIPIIGPPVAKVLELIIDTIDYLMLQPLILALQLGISLLNSINKIYTFEE